MNTPSGTARPLSDALKPLADELRSVPLPPDLADRVRSGVRVALRTRPAPTPRPGSRGGRFGVRAWSGAAAFASVLAGSAVLLLRLPPPLPLVDDSLRYGGHFVPVAPPERWPRGSAAAWLVSTELQGERLSAMGLPYDPARAGEAVRAELLLHPSGEVLAVRFLN